MAILNAWQRIDRVLTGQVWGDGADGSTTISSDPNTRATITGTATQNTGTAGSTAFANGDLVLLHQTQGTGVGQWEINKVASGGGSTSLTFQVAHNYTYGTGAQIIKIPRYTTVTVSNHTATAWNGTTGGVEVICGKTSVTVSGSNTFTGTGGFRGAAAASGSQVGGVQGEGNTGIGGTSSNANTQGGGGGLSIGETGGGGGGAGGGHATTGTNGSSGGGSSAGGTGGSAAGAADLTSMFLGGGGGGGGTDDGGGTGGSGSAGGSILIIFTKSLTNSGAVSLNGTVGENAAQYQGAGGGGAGGSCLVVCETATLGSDTITSAGGSGGGTTLAGNGGAGSVGMVAVHHASTVTGTSSPTFTDVTDTTLVEAVVSTATGYSFFM